MKIIIGILVLAKIVTKSTAAFFYEDIYLSQEKISLPFIFVVTVSCTKSTEGFLYRQSRL